MVSVTKYILHTAGHLQTEAKNTGGLLKWKTMSLNVNQYGKHNALECLHVRERKIWSGLVWFIREVCFSSQRMTEQQTGLLQLLKAHICWHVKTLFCIFHIQSQYIKDDALKKTNKYVKCPPRSTTLVPSFVCVLYVQITSIQKDNKQTKT